MMKAEKKLNIFSFSMRKLCGLLILFKIIWIICHMILHSQGALNPWKLGGYAMYTTPPVSYQAQIISLESDHHTDIKNANMPYLKFYAVAGCFAGISKRFYKNIPFQHPELIIDEAVIRLNFYEQTHAMLSSEQYNNKIGNAILTIKNNKMLIEETFCDTYKERVIHVR